MLTLAEVKLKLTEAFEPNVTTAKSVSGSNLVTKLCATVKLRLKSALEVELHESRTNTMS